jgi:hypothetical protein
VEISNRCRREKNKENHLYKQSEKRKKEVKHVVGKQKKQ